MNLFKETLVIYIFLVFLNFCFMKQIRTIHIWNCLSKMLLLICHKGGLKDTVIPILLFPPPFPRATSKFDVEN